MKATRTLFILISLISGGALLGNFLEAQAPSGPSPAAFTLSITSAGSTEDEHQVKASGGALFSITATNTNAAARYIRCANVTLTNTIPGTTTPWLDLAIPPTTTGGASVAIFPMGAAFSSGLTCWLVTGAAQSDVVEVAANEIKVFYTFR